MYWDQVEWVDFWYGKSDSNILNYRRHLFGANEMFSLNRSSQPIQSISRDGCQLCCVLLLPFTKGAVRCSAVRWGAVRRGAVRCGAVQCGAVRCSAVRCSAVR